MSIKKTSIFFCLFFFAYGENVNFVSIDGIASADGLSPTSAKPLHNTLTLSITGFQKVYILPEMYAVGPSDDVSIQDRDIEIVGSIRSDVSYGFSNSSVDPKNVDSNYDIEDIETVINCQRSGNCFVHYNGGKLAQVRRIRFVGVASGTIFSIENSELTTRKCYFAGNCSAFYLFHMNAMLNVMWCVFRPNTWNTMKSRTVEMNPGKSLLFEDCFVENVDTDYDGGVVYAGSGDSAIIRNSDFRSCQGRNGGVLCFRFVHTVVISRCSFGDIAGTISGAVLYLWGPPPAAGFSLAVEHVVMWNSTAHRASGALLMAVDCTETPFTADTVVNVTYFPYGPGLVSVHYVNSNHYVDETSVISAGDDVEVLFTSLMDGVHSLPDFQEFDILSNYIISNNNDNGNDNTNDSKKPFPVWAIILIVVLVVAVVCVVIIVLANASVSYSRKERGRKYQFSQSYPTPPPTD